MGRKIDFICVGVQKAGTSTFHDIIKQHPSLELPLYKETHFFNDNNKYRKGIDHYFEFYFKKKKKLFMGEITPEYSYFDYCADRIHKAFGAIKILLILRNPVDRAYSHYLMTRRRGLEPLSFKEALEQETNRLNTYDNAINFSYIDRGRYVEQIKRFQHKFGNENVKIILFEDLIKNTEKTILSVSSFIGLPHYNYNYSVKSNSASEPKSTFLRDFIHKPNWIKKRVGSLIPSKKIKDYLMINLNKKNLKPSKKEEIPYSFKKEIYETYFIEEIENLETIINTDLGHWKY
jgi:hypothetical protein